MKKRSHFYKAKIHFFQPNFLKSKKQICSEDSVLFLPAVYKQKSLLRNLRTMEAEKEIQEMGCG